MAHVQLQTGWRFSVVPLLLLISYIIVGQSSATDPFVFEANRHSLRATATGNRGKIEGNLGVSSSKTSHVTPCENNQDGGCWQWSDGRRMEIQDDPRSILCKIIVHTTPDLNQLAVEDIWDLTTDNSSLYGGGSLTDQTWPVENAELFEVPQVTGAGTFEGEWNSIHNRLWFSTIGAAIKVEDHVPLFISVSPQNKTMTLRAAKMDPYRFKFNTPTTLSYSVCRSENLTDLYLAAMQKFFKFPTGIPDLRIFRSPVCNTWPKFKTDLNISTLTDYVHDISKSVGTAGSFLIINRGWEVCIGDHQFNTLGFAQPKSLISLLKKNTMEAALGVHPKIGTKCQSYRIGYQGGYFVTDRFSKVLHNDWNNNNVSSVDFLNDDAVDWWKKKLKYLQTYYGITSFFFDYGQASFLPKDYHFVHVPLELQPDAYSTKYVEVAASFGNTSFVTVGRNSQQHPLFVRMPEKKSTESGLKSVIPSILQMGISGFPFVLPEVVGGSFYENGLPERWLYIRWLELNTFFPAWHFSVAPDEYDEKVSKIAKDMMGYRAKYMDTILALADESRSNGAPIIRPLWWISPFDPQTLSISDQYLLGNSLLVAPVVENKEFRNIYFPAGKWQHPVNKDKHTGPIMVPDYPVKLGELAFFEKIGD